MENENENKNVQDLITCIAQLGPSATRSHNEAAFDMLVADAIAAVRHHFKHILEAAATDPPLPPPPMTKKK